MHYSRIVADSAIDDDGYHHEQTAAVPCPRMHSSDRLSAALAVAAWQSEESASETGDKGD